MCFSSSPVLNDTVSFASSSPSSLKIPFKLSLYSVFSASAPHCDMSILNPSSLTSYTRIFSVYGSSITQSLFIVAASAFICGNFTSMLSSDTGDTFVCPSMSAVNLNFGITVRDISSNPAVR